MSFKTIKPEDHAELTHNTNCIVIDPPPPVSDLPALWLDLHVAESKYQVCGDDIPRELLKRPDGTKAIRIKAHRSVRIRTKERIGIDVGHTGLVTNVRSMAVRGLILAPGKIDPGFSPNPLVLIVHNQTNRDQDIVVDQKVAAIAFAETDSDAKECNARPAVYDDNLSYAPTRYERIAGWMGDHMSPHLGKSILGFLAQTIAAVVATIILLWLFGILPDTQSNRRPTETTPTESIPASPGNDPSANNATDIPDKK